MRDLVLCKGIHLWGSQTFSDTPMSEDNISPAITTRPQISVILGYKADTEPLDILCKEIQDD